MLKKAISYKDKIESFFNDIDNEEYLKYFNSGSFQSKYDPKYKEWNNIERVSVDSDGNVLAYIKAVVDRDSYSISHLALINISKKLSVTATKDIIEYIDHLLTKNNFHKISFSVYIGNPAEKIYDKIIKRFNGRVVGVKKSEVKLIDGKYYDEKLYEVLNV